MSFFKTGSLAFNVFFQLNAHLHLFTLASELEMFHCRLNFKKSFLMIFSLLLGVERTFSISLAEIRAMPGSSPIIEMVGRPREKIICNFDQMACFAVMYRVISEALLDVITYFFSLSPANILTIINQKFDELEAEHHLDDFFASIEELLTAASGARFHPLLALLRGPLNLPGFFYLEMLLLKIMRHDALKSFFTLPASTRFSYVIGPMVKTILRRLNARMLQIIPDNACANINLEKLMWSKFFYSLSAHC